MAVAPGTRFGPYEVLAKLGEGGMGAVYRARDTRLQRDVAIKVLLPAVANDPDRLVRFSREAQLLASLNHPNIAHVHGLEESEGTRALVMEFVEGEPLSARVEGRGLPVDEALPIARQIADALEAAHERGIVHRDLKPANIMVMTDGQVKVLDFGLAKAIDVAPAEAEAHDRQASHSPTMISPACAWRCGMAAASAHGCSAGTPSADHAAFRRAARLRRVAVAGCPPRRLRLPRWRADGREIFYAGQNSMMAVAVSTDAGFAAGTPVAVGGVGGQNTFGRFGFIDASRDGRELLFARPATNDAPREPVNVIVNWMPDPSR